jgi:hypothetical protein
LILNENRWRFLDAVEEFLREEGKWTDTPKAWREATIILPRPSRELFARHSTLLELLESGGLDLLGRARSQIMFDAGLVADLRLERCKSQDILGRTALYCAS